MIRRWTRNHSPVSEKHANLYHFHIQFSDAPLIIDRGESLQKPESAFHFVVDLLAKIGIPPSLPRADCSLWQHGAELCRPAGVAPGSARAPCPTAGREGGCVGGVARGWLGGG